MQNEKSAQWDANTARCLFRRGPSSISVPNLKRIAQFVQKLLKGSDIRKFGHMTPATPTYGSFYGPYAGRLSPLCLYQIWSGYLFSFKLLGVPKLRNWVTWPRPRPFTGRFIFHTQAGSSISVPNLKRIAQFVHTLLRGPEIRSRDPATPT